MATCGTCHREIIWATSPPEEGCAPIALDKVERYDGPGRYTLHYPAGGGRPNAIPILNPGYFAGYTPHREVCGKGTAR